MPCSPAMHHETPRQDSRQLKRRPPRQTLCTESILRKMRGGVARMPLPSRWSTRWRLQQRRLTHPCERVVLFSWLSVFAGHGDAHQKLGEQPGTHLAVSEAGREDEEIHVLRLVRVLGLHLNPQRGLLALVSDLAMVNTASKQRTTPMRHASGFWGSVWQRYARTSRRANLRILSSASLEHKANQHCRYHHIKRDCTHLLQIHGSTSTPKLHGYEASPATNHGIHDSAVILRSLMFYYTLDLHQRVQRRKRA